MSTGSFTQQSHPGNFPVRVLANNIIAHFETVRDNTLTSLQASVLKGKVKPGIKWRIAQEPAKTPYAHCGTTEIHLQETFVGFVWAMTYSVWVIYEEGIQKRLLSNTFTGKIEYNTPLLQRAKQLFDWAVTLKDNYSNWDLTLPNPEQHNTVTEEWYAERVNGIFQDIIVYDLFHEYAHLVNDHCHALEDLLGRPSHSLTEEDITLWKQTENEADIVAFDSIIDSTSQSQDYKLHKGIAVVLAHSLMLFVLRNPKNVKQVVHPDVDNRILNSITRLGLEKPEDQDYIWYLGSLCCKFFFDAHSISTDTTPAATTEALFFRYLDIFDSLKAS